MYVVILTRYPTWLGFPGEELKRRAKFDRASRIRASWSSAWTFSSIQNLSTVQITGCNPSLNLSLNCSETNSKHFESASASIRYFLTLHAHFIHTGCAIRCVPVQILRHCVKRSYHTASNVNPAPALSLPLSPFSALHSNIASHDPLRPSCGHLDGQLGGENAGAG